MVLMIISILLISLFAFLQNVLIMRMCVQTEAENAVKKAHLLKGQKREEYEKARSSTNRTEEEQSATGGRTLEKKRRVEEEALLRVLHKCRTTI